jgi:hypothetical protein
MRTHSKLILAALAATMLLSIGIGTASASRLSVNERNFELIWNELLTGGSTTKTKLEFIARNVNANVQCRVTLLGSFLERTIKKETNINQNTINHAELEGCTGGSATIHKETLPWTSRYRSFASSLPRIRSINVGLIGASFVVEAGGLTCQTRTEVNHPGVGIVGESASAPETGLETTGEPENITAERNNRIPLEGGLCAFGGEGEFGGIGLIRNLPRTAKIKITLI